MSDYTFVNIWGWNAERKYELSFDDGLCWLRTSSQVWAPVGDWNRDWDAVLRKCWPDGVELERVPEALANMISSQLGSGVKLEEQRSEWEYLYSADELINLPGNRFHKKKNLLNQFMKYGPAYEPISADNIGEIRMLQCEWCREKNCSGESSLTAENTAVKRVISDWERMPGIMGGAVRIDGKLVAYTVAEMVPFDEKSRMFVIHFEKGLDGYKGVYQGINQMFLANSAAECDFVNREQDMGLEGLRQAKMTYHPVSFLKKYKLSWRI